MKYILMLLILICNKFFVADLQSSDLKAIKDQKKILVSALKTFNDSTLIEKFEELKVFFNENYQKDPILSELQLSKEQEAIISKHIEIQTLLKKLETKDLIASIRFSTLVGNKSMEDYMISEQIITEQGLRFIKDNLIIDIQKIIAAIQKIIIADIKPIPRLDKLTIKPEEIKRIFYEKIKASLEEILKAKSAVDKKTIIVNAIENFMKNSNLKLDLFSILDEGEIVDALINDHKLIDKLVATYKKEGQTTETKEFIKYLLDTFEEFEWEDTKSKTFQDYVKTKTAEMLNFDEARKIVEEALAAADAKAKAQKAAAEARTKAKAEAAADIEARMEAAKAIADKLKAAFDKASKLEIEALSVAKIKEAAENAIILAGKNHQIAQDKFNQASAELTILREEVR